MDQEEERDVNFVVIVNDLKEYAIVINYFDFEITINKEPLVFPYVVGYIYHNWRKKDQIVRLNKKKYDRLGEERGKGKGEDFEFEEPIMLTFSEFKRTVLDREEEMNQDELYTKLGMKI
jgi:hypothetical protein